MGLSDANDNQEELPDEVVEEYYIRGKFPESRHRIGAKAGSEEVEVSRESKEILETYFQEWYAGGVKERRSKRYAILRAIETGVVENPIESILNLGLSEGMSYGIDNSGVAIDLLNGMITDLSPVRAYIDSCQGEEPSSSLENRLEMLIRGVANSKTPYGERYDLIHHPVIKRIAISSRVLRRSLVNVLAGMTETILLELQDYTEDGDSQIRAITERALTNIKESL